MTQVDYKVEVNILGEWVTHVDQSVVNRLDIQSPKIYYSDASACYHYSGGGSPSGEFTIEALVNDVNLPGGYTGAVCLITAGPDGMWGRYCTWNGWGWWYTSDTFEMNLSAGESRWVHLGTGVSWAYSWYVNGFWPASSGGRWSYTHIMYGHY